LTYSLHALLLCNDLAGLLRTMWQGVQIDDDTLALDLARAIGPRGNYLAQRHTVDHCREHLWQSRYFGPNLPTGPAGDSDNDLRARIDRDLRQLLESHHAPALEPDLEARLRAIREHFAASYSP
jgi:trimethylamine:corrinoid methyltransferase-like protein